MSIFWLVGGVYVVEHVSELVPLAEMFPVPETYPFIFELPLQDVLA
jgi:hypothetical protein